MDDSVVARIVQVGTVTALDTAQHRCRVRFPDTGVTSDWLHVLRQKPTVSVLNDGLHDHPSQVTIDENGEHSHATTVADWMPKINDTVVVLYIPIFNSDGFVIGVV